MSDLEVLAYRTLPDPGDKRRNKLITRYIALTEKIASRFISRQHPRDDINEVAYCILVDAVIKAKESLENNDLQPYIIHTLKKKLLNYVTFDHVSTVPQSCGTSTWNAPRQRRRTLTDCIANQCDVDDAACLCDQINNSIWCDTQREIVEWRLAGHTFPEISSQVNLPITTCRRYWTDFQERMKENE